LKLQVAGFFSNLPELTPPGNAEAAKAARNPVTGSHALDREEILSAGT